jgi:PAS domain S-box-containing protein
MTSVLIVDDDVVARTTLALLLSHRGMDAHAVGTIREALDAMRSECCDVALLDLRLPDGQGTDLIAPLKALRPDIGAIIVTGHAALDSAVRALEEGADAYVSKPASVNEVVARIEAVTERQRLLAAQARVEEALRESEARLRALIENIADMILVIAEDGSIRYVSSSVERVLGHRSSGDLGQNVMDYVHPDDIASVRAALALCLSECGRIQPFAARVRHADGSWRELEGTGLNRLHDPSVGGVVLNCRDVTARRRADRELRHHVDLGNLVAHVSSLFISSPSSDVDAAINAALEAIGAFSGADRSFLFRVDPAQVRIGATHEWRALGVPSRLNLLGDVRCADYPWLTQHLGAGLVAYVPDVERMPVEAREEQCLFSGLGVRAFIAVPVTYQGTPMGVLTLDSSNPRTWSESDITMLRTVGEILANVLERQHTELQLVQSAKMASLGIMAGGIAHELRNPLGVIYAAAQLMRDRQHEHTLREDGIDRILAASRRASQIVDGLLTFARPGDGQMRTMDVRAALADALALVSHRLDEAHVRLSHTYALGLPPIVGNSGMLAQVFANLVLNACNAMPDGGTLMVTTRLATEGRVEVIFTDSGVGIPPENLPRVFDPFFTTMPVGKGTGLGLTISYSIVQRHGGTIGVESQPGGGTRVTVRLPADTGSHGGDDGSHHGGG